MYIMCNKPLTFVSKTLSVFSVTQEDVGKIIEAPDWIKDTLLFNALGDEIRVYKEMPVEEPAPSIKSEPETTEAPVEEPVEEPVEVKVEKPRTTKKKKGEASDV